MNFPNLINHVGDYSFKGFIYQHKEKGGADEPSWAGTLVFRGTRIARVQYAATTGEFDIDPIDESAYEDFLTFATQWAAEACTDLPTRDEAGFCLLSHLADIAYHLRRLEVISKRSATFQLRSDPPERYRYLRNSPLTPAVAAQLRTTYGDDLACILREEDFASRVA